jgi:biopolymer transport protein ExbB
MFSSVISGSPSRLVLVAMLVALGAAALPAVAQEAGMQPPMVDTGGTLPRSQAMADKGPIPTKDLWTIMEEGGPLMIPIAGCSLLLVAFVFERMIALRRRRVVPKAFVTRFMQQLADGELDRDQALALCEDNGSPVAQVFEGAVRKWGRPSVEIEQAIIDAGERVTNGLRRFLRAFNGIATLSPLLGFLGTVFGMIEAFNAVATSDALGRPELLASGISQALLTTAAGLTVAIPAMILHWYFVSRVDRLIIEIDGLAQKIVNTISAEELENRASRPKAPKSRKPVKEDPVT